MDSLIWILIIFFVVVPFINQIYKAGKTFQSRNSGSSIPNEKPVAVKNNLLPVVIILVLLGIGAALFFSGEIKNIGFLVYTDYYIFLNHVYRQKRHVKNPGLPLKHHLFSD